MFARVATFEGVDVSATEQTSREALERMRPVFAGLRGFRRVLDLVDRDSGRELSVYFFDSEADLNAAEPVFDQEMPRLLGDLFQGFAGRRTSVTSYEVLFDESA
jgi:hypothetical protein